MDRETAVLLALVGVLAVNQAVMRTPRLQRDDRVYWTVQFMDLLMAGAVIGFGLPGFDHLPAVSVVVGLLFVMHVAQNHSARSKREEAERRERVHAERELSEQNRATRAPDEDF